MNRHIFFLGLIVLAALPLAADHHLEEEQESAVLPGARMTFWTDLNKWDLLVQSGLTYDEDETLSYKIVGGTYYRIHKNVKAGLLYTWDNGEDQLLSLDVTPRFLIPTQGERHSVVSLKTRYTYNLTDEDSSLFLLPGYTYFRMNNRQPRWNVTGAYGLYLPDLTQGPWFHFLYHFSESVKGELKSDFLITDSTDWIYQWDVCLGLILAYNPH
ncbi:MAG: hypothetical protein PQJ60_04415 [Spirochaetales bacterium]|nr:hypothetical protein [Spirochaetales bacterium]